MIESPFHCHGLQFFLCVEMIVLFGYARMPDLIHDLTSGDLILSLQELYDM